MTIYEALDFLNTLVDDSDPDIELDQTQHLLQTSEAIRADGHEDWFVLTGLLHDLGKVLCLYGEPQWAVVGDTFPVGCRFSERIVYSEFFDAEPRRARRALQHAARRLRGRLRAAQRDDVVGTRRIPVPRVEELSARAGALHDSLPLVLRVASRGRVRLASATTTTARCCRGSRRSIPTTSTRSAPRRRTGRSCGRTTWNSCGSTSQSASRSKDKDNVTRCRHRRPSRYDAAGRSS